MDNLTHGLAGALVAQAGLRQRYGHMATVALVLGAELPDFDFLFDLAGPVAGFQYHRGITHAFTGGFGLALLAAAILYGIWRYRTFWRLVGLLYLGVLLHIWMDYLTSYGTQVLLPFDTGRYTADAVFIIDYFYTGVIVTALVAVRMIRRQRQERYRKVSLVWLLGGAVIWFVGPSMVERPLLRLALSGLGMHLALFSAVIMLLARVSRPWPPERSLMMGRCGVAALAAYMGLCMANHTVARQRFIAALGPHMATVQHVAALPMPGGVHRWRGIADTGTTYLVSYLNLLTPAAAAPEVVAKGPATEIVQATSDYRLVRIFQEFARFPVVEYRQQNGEQVVRYTDLRFTGYGRDRSWFDLEVRLDTDGRVLGIEFLNRLFLPHHTEF